MRYRYGFVFGVLAVCVGGAASAQQQPQVNVLSSFDEAIGAEMGATITRAATSRILIANLQKQVADLTAQVTAAKADADALRGPAAERDALKKAIEALQTQNSVLHEQTESLLKQLEGSRHEIEVLRAPGGTP